MLLKKMTRKKMSFEIKNKSIKHTGCKFLIWTHFLLDATIIWIENSIF